MDEEEGEETDVDEKVVPAMHRTRGGEREAKQRGDIHFDPMPISNIINPIPAQFCKMVAGGNKGRNNTRRNGGRER